MNIRRIVAVAGAAMLGLVAKPSAGASYTDVSYITTSAANQDWVLLNYTPKASTILEATVEIPASGYRQTHTPFCARGCGTKSVAHDLKIQEGTPGLVLLLR